MSKPWYESYFGEGSTLEAENCVVVKDKLGRIFVAGTPLDEDKPEGEGHNCDQMGCGTCGPHVILVTKSVNFQK